MTSNTSALAVDIASDKDITNKLLSAAGLPVPKSDSVRTLRGALQAARRIGYPVVIKPLDGNHGRGVVLNLRDEAELEAGFDVAKAESRSGYVLVESFITGNDYRFLVVGGRIAAVAERVPAHVIGDGERTVAELVEATNADPRRGVGHEKVLTRIKVDDAAVALVAAQGLTMDAVPEQGVMVKLALTGNMSTGGISIDRTLDAHPDNVEIAEEAARVVGLDVAGIDFISPDITEPVRETGGAICEVNAAPGFRMHTHPTIGEPQYVAKPVIDLLFPPGTPSRVPIIAVTGTNGKTTTSRMIAHVFKGMGRKVGMTSTDGIVIDERLVIRADASGPKSARMVLQNPRVDIAVLEVARGGILREGLGYDRNDVAVVTNVTADHLGLRGINTLEQLADVKSVVVEAVPRGGSRRAQRRRPARRGHGPALPRRDRLVHDGRARHLDPVDGRPALPRRRPGAGAREGRARRVDRPAPGQAHDAGGVHPPAPGHLRRQGALQRGQRHGRRRRLLRRGRAPARHPAGLRTFSTNYHLAPGRLNHIDVNGVNVFVDYAHNAAGLDALGEFIAVLHRWPGRGARGGPQAPPDRRDRHRRGPPRLRHPRAGAHRRPALRPRAWSRRTSSCAVASPGEVAALLEQGVREAMAEGARAKEVRSVPLEIDAVRWAVEQANAGDVVAICADQTDSVYTELEALGHSAMHE